MMRDQRQLPVVVVRLLLGTLVDGRNYSCFLECRHLCSFLPCLFLAVLSSSAWSFHKKEGSGLEQIELLLHIAL